MHAGACFLALKMTMYVICLHFIYIAYISVLQIGCNKCIYIFDIVNLGLRAFDCGLADIMDSADILKVKMFL
jgi:hypothetical protein